MNNEFNIHLSDLHAAHRKEHMCVTNLMLLLYFKDIKIYIKTIFISSTRGPCHFRNILKLLLYARNDLYLTFQYEKLFIYQIQSTMYVLLSQN